LHEYNEGLFDGVLGSCITIALVNLLRHDIISVICLACICSVIVLLLVLTVRKNMAKFSDLPFVAWLLREIDRTHAEKCTQLALRYVSICKIIYNVLGVFIGTGTFMIMYGYMVCGIANMLHYGIVMLGTSLLTYTFFDQVVMKKILEKQLIEKCRDVTEIMELYTS